MKIRLDFELNDGQLFAAIMTVLSLKAAVDPSGRECEAEIESLKEPQNAWLAVSQVVSDRLVRSLGLSVDSSIVRKYTEIVLATILPSLKKYCNSKPVAMWSMNGLRVFPLSPDTDLSSQQNIAEPINEIRN